MLAHPHKPHIPPDKRLVIAKSSTALDFIRATNGKVILRNKAIGQTIALRYEGVQIFPEGTQDAYALFLRKGSYVILPGSSLKRILDGRGPWEPEVVRAY